MTDVEINYLFSLAGGISYSGGTRNSATNTQLRKFVSLLLETKSEVSPQVRKPLTGTEIDSLIQTATETSKTDSSHSFEHGDCCRTRGMRKVSRLAEKLVV